MQPMAGLFSQNERHPGHQAFSMVSLCRENTRLNMRDIPSVFPSLLHPHPGQPILRPANKTRKRSSPARTTAIKLVNRSP